jgi:hypothetical protein
MSSESAPTNPIADLPTGEPIPQSSPTPPSSSSPSARPSLPLRTLLSLTPRNLDAFLAHLNRCLSTPSGIDTVLLFLCYTSRFSSSLLAALAKRALHRSAADWIALVSASRTTVVAVTDSSKLPSTAAAAASLLLADRLKNLSGLLSEARTILRLWGLLGMYFWAKRLLARSLSPNNNESEKDAASAPRPTTLDTVVSYSQLATCIVFQALENGAYLSSKGVMGWSPAKQGWAMKWSARLWGLYVGIELGKLAAERVAGGERKDVKAAAQWKSAFVRNLAWAPLTVHWGSDKGFVADWMVGALASVPGVIQMAELWRETA